MKMAKVKVGTKPRGSLSQRFEKKFVRGEEHECWLWNAYRIKKGYGRIGAGPAAAGVLLAHRVAYELTKGPIPNGFDVLHRCDNPPCVNPAHLFLGTNYDNMLDRDMKGRVAKGEYNGHAKLNRDQVRYIRAMPGAHSSIAKEIGIARQTVGKIKSRKRWGHLP